jgi:hypothetical protein
MGGIVFVVKLKKIHWRGFDFIKGNFIKEVQKNYKELTRNCCYFCELLR